MFWQPAVPLEYLACPKRRLQGLTRLYHTVYVGNLARYRVPRRTHVFTPGCERIHHRPRISPLGRRPIISHSKSGQPSCNSRVHHHRWLGQAPSPTGWWLPHWSHTHSGSHAGRAMEYWDMQLTRGRRDVVRTVDNRFNIWIRLAWLKMWYFWDRLTDGCQRNLIQCWTLDNIKNFHRLKFTKKFALMMLKHKSVPAFSLCSTFP